MSIYFVKSSLGLCCSVILILCIFTVYFVSCLCIVDCGFFTLFILVISYNLVFVWYFLPVFNYLYTYVCEY